MSAAHRCGRSGAHKGTTRPALRRIVSNIAQVQDRLGRPIALENPSHYLAIDGHEFDELDFLVEIARRSGCTLLLDVNNIYVSANNLGYRPEAVIDAVPGGLITEVHLAGHSADPALGTALLIDSHDAPIAPAVWSLYGRLIARIGARPTLIERDDHIPEFADLQAERDHADRLMRDAVLAQAA